MSKKNIMDEWSDSWPAALVIAAVLAGAVTASGIATLIIGQIFDWSDRTWMYATGVGVVAVFPVWINRVMRSHYSREMSEEIMRGRRVAYASGVYDQQHGSVGPIEPEIATEVAALKAPVRRNDS